MAWIDDINQTIGSYDEQGNFIPGRLQGSYGENGMWEGTIGGQESFQNEQVTLPNGMTAYLDPPPAPGQPQTARILDPTGDQSKWTSVALDGEGNIVWSAPKEASGSNVITGWVNDVGKNVVLPAIAGYLGVSGLAGLTGAAGAAGGAAGGGLTEAGIAGMDLSGLAGAVPDFAAGGYAGAASGTGAAGLAGGLASGAAGGLTAAEIAGMDLSGVAGSVPDFAAGGYSGAASGVPGFTGPGLTDPNWGISTPPPPTGAEGDWYLDPQGNPIPSGSSIMPDGTIIPPGVPVPSGGVPLDGTIPPGTSVPGLNENGLPNTTSPTTTPGTPSGTPGTSGAPSTGGFNPNWGGLLSSILGAVGANEQTKAYERIADRSWNAGEPSRGRFEASMTPGWDVSSIPGFSGALDASTNSYLKGISAKRGNPAGIGGAQGETQAYVVNNTALPWVNQYQNANMYAGGLASLSGNAQRDAMNAIQSQGNIYGQIGSGISDFMGDTSNNNSTNWLSELAKQFGGLKFS